MDIQNLTDFRYDGYVMVGVEKYPNTSKAERKSPPPLPPPKK